MVLEIAIYSLAVVIGLLLGDVITSNPTNVQTYHLGVSPEVASQILAPILIPEGIAIFLVFVWMWKSYD